MKKLYKILSPVVLLVLASCSSSRYYYNNNEDQNYTDQYQQQQGDITYQQFYDDLSPYGQWIDYQGYGYAWVPSYSGFRPYSTNGYWTFTNYGWTWVSNYNWGWAPFHYGRWTMDPFYGWVWIPGYEWSPAWVAWRSGGDYYGWAPIGPGMNVNVGYGYGNNIPADYWSFVPQRYVMDRQVNNYYINRQQNVTIINNTTIINNIRVVNTKNIYNSGPSVTEVQRTTHQTIRPVTILQRNSAGSSEVSGSRLTMFRPVVKTTTDQQQQQIKPKVVTNFRDIRNYQQPNRNENDVKPNDHNQQNTLNPIDRVQEPNPNVKKDNNPFNRGNQPIFNKDEKKQVNQDNNFNHVNDNPQNSNNNDTRRFNNPATNPPANKDDHNNNMNNNQQRNMQMKPVFPNQQNVKPEPPVNINQTNDNNKKTDTHTNPPQQNNMNQRHNFNNQNIKPTNPGVQKFQKRELGHPQNIPMNNKKDDGQPRKDNDHGK